MLYEFNLVGQMPILYHADDVEAADRVAAWRKAAENKSVSVAGDDRSPPWTWQTYLYHDGDDVVMPQENIMACLGKAGAMVPMPKGRSTFKSVSQSGLIVCDESGDPCESCEFRNDGKPVAMADIVAMASLPFADQAAGARKLGFELKVKRATVGPSKHIRVRAMFKAWRVRGWIETLDPLITGAVLAEFFSIGGRKVGLLDWRPGSKKSPGPYGTFRAEVRPAGSARKSA